MAIHTGITEEAKESMKGLIEDREKRVAYIVNGVQKNVAEMQERGQDITSYDLHAFIKNLLDAQYALQELEAKMELWELYSQ